MAEPFIGEIRMFAGDVVPNGWAPCNGQLLSARTYAALFSVLGHSFGGDGADLFALPNLQAAYPVHPGEPELVGSAAGAKVRGEEERAAAPPFAVQYCIALNGYFPRRP